MPPRRPPDAHLTAGRAALARGDWRAARESFAAALEERESAAALNGLSEALWWLDEVPESLRLRERAFGKWLETGELCQAARAAVWLAREQETAMGDAAAAHDWMQRAERLATQAAPCVEVGWVELMQAKFAPDSAGAAAHAGRAHECALRFADRDLEFYALSEQGRALVMKGRVEQGMALLDEAVAAATGGEMRSILAIGETCCNMIVACDRALDLARAAQWCRAVDEFARRHHFVQLFASCQAVYGGLLVATGRWPAAEEALTRSARALEKGHPPVRAYPLARLAVLRVRQGRLEEAAQLLEGLETHAAAALAVAELSLARGEPALAAAAVERRLQVVGEDATLAAPLLELLVDARLAMGDRAAARAAAERLHTLAVQTARPIIEAAASLALARVEEGATLPDALLQRALEIYAALGLPFESARARLQWARSAAATDAEVATSDARLALQAFERLGAKLWADAATSLLSSPGETSRAAPGSGPEPGRTAATKAAAPRPKRR